jgi:hypothetical protein
MSCFPIFIGYSMYLLVLSSLFLPHHFCSDINGGQVDDEDFGPDMPY